MNEKSKTERQIKSYVRREGRMTPGQRRALETLWGKYVIEFSDALMDLSRLFAREAPKIIEIGIGNGLALIAMAKAHPEWDYIGIDVYRPGLGKCLQDLEREGINNVRLYCEDAELVLENCIPDNSLDAVMIFFPDPWPKKRHHKRRLIQKPFVNLLCEKLKIGGQVHLATDWEEYAEQMLSVLSAASGFNNLAGSGHYIDRPSERPLTKFEKRGQKLGHAVWDLVFVRVD